MSQVDLSALRMQPAPVLIHRRPLGPRLLLAAIALLAVVVGLTFAWPWLAPVRAVPMAAVRPAPTTGAGAAAVAAAAIAEAAGWIEPDPFPTLVRPLVNGRVEAILVLEGAAVEAGSTVVARLASAGLLAARDRAVATAAEREREHQAAAAELAVAAAELAQRADLRAAAIEARDKLAQTQGRLAAAEGVRERTAAEATAARAAATAQEQLAATGGSYPVALARARAAAAAADAAARAAGREAEAAAGELAAAHAAAALADELLAAPKVLEARVRSAEAALAKATAAVATANVELEITRRELAWTEVLAPASGVVLKLLAAPGAEAGPDAEPLLSIYDPAKLRARIDVPLGAIAGVHDGQQVELRSEVLGGSVVRGVVQRAQHESDLLKNTLQVKVRVLDPPPLLRPETLCRARFLGGGRTDGTAPAAASAALAFLVPKAAVHDGRVFRFDPAAGRARAVAVTVLQTQGDDAVVQGDLSAAMRVILVPVQDGEAVQEANR